jgi:cytochrome c-type biogenesis protein CcmH/NrfF
MRIVWLIPITILVLGAGAFFRARRNRGAASFSPDPVSGQWLAEARTREEHPW